MKTLTQLFREQHPNREDFTAKEVKDWAASFIEDAMNAPDPYMCPTCNSCGETGCCPPDKGQAVKCLYGEGNVREYKEMARELEEAVTMLAEWVVAVDRDSSWDGWDEHFKNAGYRPCGIRSLIDVEIERLKNEDKYS